MITGHNYHDDIQGVLGTALAGVTTWTPAQYRNTGMVLNEVQKGDIFTMIFQMPHRKGLSINLDDVHLHYIPIASVNGNIAFSYAWGWYNIGDTIPDVLPNTGTTADIALLTTDQYKLKLSSLISNLTYPASEGYSSILLVKITCVAPAAGTDWWGASNKLAIAYMDAHYPVNRYGSYNTASD